MRIQIITIVSLLLFGCGRSITSIDLSEAASPELLLKTREEAVQLLGTPYKEQSRTGGMFALYFQDADDTVISATFKEEKVVDFVVCPSSSDLLLKGKKGWIMEKQNRFDEDLEVYSESSSGHSVFQKGNCAYFTTNWIQNRKLEPSH